MNDADPILEVSGLDVRFHSPQGVVHAVRDVSFSVAPGEIVALVGESGSGKSTIGLSLMRLLDHEESARVRGAIRFTGKDGRSRDLMALSPRSMRRIRGDDIAMIFQEPMSSLDPIFTVGAQIVEAIRIHQSKSAGEATSLALEMLHLLGIAHPRQCFASYPHQISGGMIQRVMIAMALACNPTLLVADEPTTGLDVTIQAQIIEHLQTLQRRHRMSVLFITHDLGLVAEIADRVFVLYAGQVRRVRLGGDHLRCAPHALHRDAAGLASASGLLQPARLPDSGDPRQRAERVGLSVGLRVPPALPALRAVGLRPGHAGAGACRPRPPRPVLPLARNPGSMRLMSVATPSADRGEIRPMSAATSLVEVEGLRKWFPIMRGLIPRPVAHVKAVEEVSFSIDPHEVLGIAGGVRIGQDDHRPHPAAARRAHGRNDSLPG